MQKFFNMLLCFIGGSVIGVAILFTIMTLAGKFSHQCLVLKTGEVMCTQVFR